MTALEDTKTEAAVVAQIADENAEAQRVPVVAGEVYLVRSGDGGIRTIDTDKYADTPRHAEAHRVVTDAASFANYVNRHRTPGTEVYAHTNSSTVVAVIDSHQGTEAEPGWQKHWLTLALEKSKSWIAWEKVDGQLLDQATFADFLDDRWSDVIEPDAALMVDLATTFQAKTKVDFDSGVRMDSGEVKLTYAETVTARAGQKGEITIPKKVKLALRPYVGGPIYSIWAHFRYRLQGGDVRMGFRLERPENTLDAAFADIVTDIRDGRAETDAAVAHEGIGDVPIFSGKPSK